MRVIFEVDDTKWGFLSALLKRFAFVRIQQTDEMNPAISREKKPTFDAVQLDTAEFRFNREEANER